MYRNVIVPLDLVTPADVALEVAATLARRIGATVRLVTVASPGLDHDQDRADLERVAESVEAPRVSVEILESNEVAASLLRAAKTDALLCLETRARGPLGAIVLGSVAAEILRAATVPVLLVGPATKPHLSLELMEVCVDGPDATATLVPVAGAWSRAMGMRVRLVHAWVPSQSHFATLDRAAEELDTAARLLLAEFGITAERDVLAGRLATEVLVDDAERRGASLVVVAVRPLSGLRRRAMGSVAAAVSHVSGAAVLAVPCRRSGD